MGLGPLAYFLSLELHMADVKCERCIKRNAKRLWLFKLWSLPPGAWPRSRTPDSRDVFRDVPSSRLGLILKSLVSNAHP